MKELAQAIGRPPHQWTPERLWQAYEQLDRSKVRGSGERVLTDLVSLVRVALHQDDELVPYPDLVRERYHAWLLAQENAGRTFTGEQLAWLERIRDHVAAALAITTDDFGYTPFVEAGGLGQGGAGLRRRPRAAPRRAQRGAGGVSDFCRPGRASVGTCPPGGRGDARRLADD